jgi:endonuclease/exonuclease/phosphatase (EEP) superfamily protein YafD
MVSGATRPGWGARLARAAGWIYLAALGAAAIVLGTVGERWWPGAVLLYLPRVVLLLPLVLLAPFCLGRERRRWFGVQAGAAIVIGAALMGPHWSRPRPSGGPSLRLFSYNVWYGERGEEAIRREIEEAHPDVVVMQAIAPPVVDYFRGYFHGWQLRADGEFLIASRFPIVKSDPPDPDDAFAHYQLATPLGTIDLFNMHPDSPRGAFEALRGEGLRHVSLSDLSRAELGQLESDTARRERQVNAVAAAAARARHLVVIAGDTNLPEWSALYRRYLSCYQDGFSSAGSGFGFTFPANRLWPWMRIDRVMVGPGLRVARFGVGSRGGSDHRPVWAELTAGAGKPGGLDCAK